MSDKVYSVITDRIIERLRDGVIPWRKPWKAGNLAPQNLVSGHAYRGVNIFTTLSMGYGSPYWLTYKQAQTKGGQVKKGEHATPIVFWKFLSHTEKLTNGETREKQIPMLRYFSVFNSEQIDGIDVPETTEPTEPADIPTLVDGYLDGGPNLQHVPADRAFYAIVADSITMPESAQFDSVESYYATLYHELGHSTGHTSRLSRTFGRRMGEPNYAREELVAEMTAAYLCAETGINPLTEDNSVAYIQRWIQKLQDDPRAVVVAAGAAQKSADLIRGIVKDQKEIAA